jgi:hypothetical protein
MLAREPPADLDARREVRVELGFGEADEPDERRAAHDLDRPEAPAAQVEQQALVLDQRVALLAAQELREVAHHLRAQRHCCERLAVRVAPPPQEQAVRRQCSPWQTARILPPPSLRRS